MADNHNFRIKNGLEVGDVTVIDSSRNIGAAQSVKVNAIAPSNSSPATDSVELSGYGIIGNRPSLYITNAKADGQIVLGISGAHNANNKLTVNSSGVTVDGTISSSTISADNFITTGYLRGPASFVIDPAAHGNDTGTVVIAGNLQVDGTTTTINSTTISIDDLNITLAADAANSAAANGAGIQVAGAGANIIYANSTNSWNIDKRTKIQGPSVGTASGNTATLLSVAGSRGNIDFKEFRTAAETDWNSTTYKLQHRIDTTPMGSIDFVVDAAYGRHIDIVTQGFNSRFTASGRLGIGTTTPAAALEVLGNIVLRQSASNSETVYITSNARGGGTADADLRLGNSVNGDILTIHNANVGIGTTGPGTKLDVNGVITATGGTSTAWNTAYGWGNHASPGYVPTNGSTITTTSTQWAKVQNTVATGYSEFAIANSSDQKLIMGSIGPSYTNTDWAGSRYIYNTAGNLRIKSVGGLSFYSGGTSHTTNLALDFATNRVATFAVTPTVGGDVVWHEGNLPGTNIPKFHNNAVLTDSASTTSFIAELTSDYGCFGNNQVTLKIQWSYSGSSNLVTGNAIIGTIELAGCTIETWGGTYKHVRITRPNTGTGGHMVVEYNDQSTGYAPGWREIWTSESDGSGSGLDADKLDGIEGASFLRSDESDSVAAGTTYTWGASDTEAIIVGRAAGSAEQIYIGGWGTSNLSGVHQIRGSSNLHIDSASGGDIYLNNYNSSKAVYIAGANLAWHAGNDGSGSGLDADTVDGISSASFLRSDVADTAAGKITLDNAIARSGHHTGHLEGSYNNVGANSSKSNPIYTIGSAFNPNETTLGNMYGIGFTYADASFISGSLDAGTVGWGMYVASDGDARVFLNGQHGTISTTGQHYAANSLVWNAGNDGAGSGLDADTLDGAQPSEDADVSTIVKRTSAGEIKCARFNVSDGSNHMSHFVSSTYNSIGSTSGASGSARDLRFTQGQNGTIMTITSTNVRMHKPVLLDGSANTSFATSNINSTQSSDVNGATRFHMNFTKADGTTSLGRITSNNYGTTYTTSSDYRLKEDLLEVTDATARLLSIQTRNFKWIGTDFRTDGFLAHELALVVPDAVVGEKDAMSTPTLYSEEEELPEGVSAGDVKVASVPDYQSIDQSKLVPLLIKTVQELEARITALENA